MERTNEQMLLIGTHIICFYGEIRNEPTHDKTYNKTCVTNKDSDQPVHPSSLAMVLVYPSLDSLEAVEGICSQ